MYDLDHLIFIWISKYFLLINECIYYLQTCYVRLFSLAAFSSIFMWLIACTDPNRTFAVTWMFLCVLTAAAHGAPLLGPPVPVPPPYPPPLVVLLFASRVEQDLHRSGIVATLGSRIYKIELSFQQGFVDSRLSVFLQLVYWLVICIS